LRGSEQAKLNGGGVFGKNRQSSRRYPSRLRRVDMAYRETFVRES
jgi:hypothetical protein